MASLPKDIRVARLPALNWDSQGSAESLRKVVAHAVEQADAAITWYLSTKRKTRIWARLLRLGAVVLTAGAGILPVLIQIWTTPEGKPPLAPAWASVLLGLAVLLVALDRFFGFSSGWMRYIAAELQISQALQAFELDSEAAHASHHGGPPTPEQVQTVLVATKAFLEQVNAIVVSETITWVGEFQEALKQIDEGTRASAAAAQTGSVVVTIQNGDQVDAPGWTFSINHAPPRTYTGKSAAVTGLMSGDHVIKVSGQIQKRVVRSETVVTVRAGAIASLDLMLS